MHKRNRITAAALAAVIAAGLLSGISTHAADASIYETGTELTCASDMPGLSDARYIDLDTAERTEAGNIKIKEGGTYVLSGTLEGGKLIVNAKDEEVILVLNGVSISCDDGSAVYIKKAKLTELYMPEGTENTLSDGAEYTPDEEDAEKYETNACVYSKSDLVISGPGKLTVTGRFRNGISSADTLEINSASLKVDAAENGIVGKEACIINNSEIRVSCGKNAVISSGDGEEKPGSIEVYDSVLDLNSGRDGIQSQTSINIENTECTVVSGGGHSVSMSENGSAKGLKAGTELSISGGSYTMDCSDDAFHAAEKLTVHSGEISVDTGDDAFHCDEELYIEGGNINISSCYEGIEAADIWISGGNIRIVSSDDGLNAGGGTDSSGMTDFAGRRGMDFFSGAGDYSINISGGNIYILSGGDGVDSNGTITMSGGTVQSFCSGMADGAIDYEYSFEFTGGTLLAVGGGMPEAPSSSTVPVLYILEGSPAEYDSCTAIVYSGGSCVFRSPVSGSNIVFSSPELQAGDSCRILTAVDCSDCAYGLSDSDFTGGNEILSIELEEGITQYGSGGFGFGSGFGFGGGFGGRDGFNGGPGGDGSFPGGPNGESDNSFPGRPDGGGNGSFPGGFSGGAQDGFPEMPGDFTPPDDAGSFAPPGAPGMANSFGTT